jgi:Arc/MetJ family transcription regulator
MRTTIDVDDKLIEEAAKLSGAKTKKDAIAIALAAYVHMKKREELRAMIGQYDHGMTLKELQKIRDED